MHVFTVDNKFCIIFKPTTILFSNLTLNSTIHFIAITNANLLKNQTSHEPTYFVIHSLKYIYITILIIFNTKNVESRYRLCPASDKLTSPHKQRTLKLKFIVYE